jgi:signal transduction histidine kinase
MHRFKRRVAELVEERTQFMLRTAHNMRAPLAAGLSMLDLIEEGYSGPVAPKQQEMLSKIEARLRALHAMIGEMLTIAKARDFSREITDVIVDLDRLAAWTEALFREDAQSKRIVLEVDVEPGLPDIDSGADLLEQVMSNLVSNAIKYTPAGGRVHVRFFQVQPDEIRIVVEDTGIGIPDDEQGKLFKEYFRASNAKQTAAAGTGLGLALVRQTVDRHRGRIQLTSKVGKGTRVEVDLPTRQPGSKARAARNAELRASRVAR